MKKTTTFITILICCLCVGAHAQSSKTAEEKIDEAKPTSPVNANYELLGNSYKQQNIVSTPTLKKTIDNNFGQTPFQARVALLHPDITLPNAHLKHTLVPAPDVIYHSDVLGTSTGYRWKE